MAKYILILYALFLLSCKSKTDKPQVETDESQILNITLDKIIGSDTTYRYHLKDRTAPVPYIAFTHKIDSLEYFKRERWIDSVQNVLDTATLFVTVYKQNEDMVEAYIDMILDTIKNRRTDTAFNYVLNLLCRQNFSKDTIDISLLKPKYNFKIYNADIAPVDRVKKIGSLRFSKIAFNLTKDTACIFTSFHCGEFCSKGDIYFFIKVHGKWRYIKKWELWKS